MPFAFPTPTTVKLAHRLGMRVVAFAELFAELGEKT